VRCGRKHVTRVVINGFGRIGRAPFKIVHDESPDLELVALNDIAPIEDIAYLLRQGAGGDLVKMMSWYDNEWG
jgi:glyceraldehyde-3-phosphate dehydrogenase/erythrose-4-phosphate dehydrogenase